MKWSPLLRRRDRRTFNFFPSSSLFLTANQILLLNTHIYSFTFLNGPTSLSLHHHVHTYRERETELI